MATIYAIAIAATSVLAAPPASAHTITGVAPSNYRSIITAISPPRRGLRVEILDLGRRVRVVNHTAHELVIFGYSGEPYLRVGPDGAYANTRSAATYLNRAPPPYPTTSTTLPRAVDPTAPPAWQRISSGRSVTWRDRRTRWEGPPPPAVAAAPSTAHIVDTFAIELEDAVGDPIAVVGEIVWTPAPSPWPWVGGAVLVGLVVAATGVSGAWPVLLPWALALLVGTDLVHSFGVGLGAHDPLRTEVFKVLVGGFYETVAWLLAVPAIAGLARRRDTALVLSVLSAATIAIFGGVTDLRSLTHPNDASVMGTVVVRAQVALTAGLGMGIAIAAGLVLLGRSPLPPDQPPAL